MITPLSLESFHQQIEQEFCQGSAIAPNLFAAAVHTVPDTQVFPGGDVTYPIHEALNWHVTRFGHQARQTLYAGLLLNEDGLLWQAKLSSPRQEPKRDQRGNSKLDALGQPIVKNIKYESRRGEGARPYLPPVDSDTRHRIAERYGVVAPLPGESFWSWLEEHPEIPIIFTEGAKKALCLLSLGYVAIALFGVNGGYRKLLDGSRQLIPNLDRFTVAERRVCLAFDQDASQETQQKVAAALSRFGGLLSAAGCVVSIAQWQPEQGKGVDDLVVQAGAIAWDRACSEALPLEHWRIWQRLERRLTWNAALQLQAADLSTLQPQALPEEGVIAIASPKGTGKTKFLAQQVAGQDKVLSATHRIALGRNLCQRLELNWRGDLDKTPDGRFITGAAYTLRVGFCVDSLLAIDPERFQGCDLVIDEVVQVLRHLVTSSTTNKDGRRPALLARFKALIQAAKRVLVADADLDNTTLHCLRELRGDNAPIFLIRNDCQPQGYPVRFLQASDRTVVVSEMLADVSKLAAGKAIFIATDSKGTSKTLAQLIHQQSPDKRVLVINSETSGGASERAFNERPDEQLLHYDVVIATPSLATGVSIETQDIITKVYGIFTGSSSTDADMTQALSRVRQPVDRVVWCAQRGSNYSRVSRSTNPLELKTHLQQRTSAIVSVIRSSLREDTVGLIDEYNWQADPWANFYASIAAEQNRSMLQLRDALLVRLRYEGNQVTVEEQGSNPLIRNLLKSSRNQLRQLDAESLVGAKQLTYSEVLLLEQRESLSPEEQKAIARYYFCEFYAIDPDSLTPEAVLWDNEGRRRGELLNLEAQLFPDVAIDGTARAIEKQAAWNQGVCPWDISGSELRRRLRDKLQLNEFLNLDREWQKEDLAVCAARARELTPQIKAILHLTISDRMSDVQVVHQLLSQMGVKVAFRWQGTYPAKIRIYRLETDCWQQLQAILERRAERRKRLSQKDSAEGSPVSSNNEKSTGDPSPEVLEGEAEWLTPESLTDIRQMWEAADSEEVQQAIRDVIPIEVLRRAIAS